jgi:hypothetical protein
MRRTARPRPMVRPMPLAGTHGYPLTHPVARRWWSALLGPGAVADLLRLATAAQRGRSLPRPVHLDQLARAGLVHFAGRTIHVVTALPRIPPGWLAGLHPTLRREHEVVTEDR